jgi:hypothetical protein
MGVRIRVSMGVGIRVSKGVRVRVLKGIRIYMGRVYRGKGIWRKGYVGG